MGREWLAMEHYRLHSVEAWPESPRKDKALVAIRSSLAGLSRIAEPLDCLTCASRKAVAVRNFPQRPRDPVVHIIAAA